MLIPMLTRFKHVVATVAVLVACSSAFAGEGVSVVSWAWSTPSGGTELLDGTFPLVVQTGKPGASGAGITLSAAFTLPSGWSGPLGIVLYKNNMSARVSVNGVYIDSLGRSGPDFFFQPYISRGVQVPQSVLVDGENVLSLELWNDTGTYKLRMLDFMDEARYRASMTKFNFLDVQLPRFASILLMFVAVYSMFLYINYRKKKESFFLSLGALLFSVYLLNVSVFDSTARYLMVKAFLYSCFPLSIVFLYRFFRTYLKIKTSNRTMWIITGVGVVFTLGYYFQRDTAALDGWHSLMLLYPVSAICYASYGVVSCLRRRETEQIPILVRLALAIVFSAYDIVYFIGDLTPFILLQGIGFMCLILGTFFCFSQEIADTNRKCAEYALEMEINKDTRESLFTQIQHDTEKSEEIGATLGRSVERVGALVSQYLASVDQINGNLEVQSSHVASNKERIGEIFAALERTSGMVAQHESLVEITVRNIKELAEGIKRTDELVKASGSTFKKLSEVCVAADRDVTESTRFVDDLASYSKNINDIVKSIGDIAEQTNVLSINAAIEAARSGQMGKGFAVVAGEIRSLATKSGSSASEINTIVGTMLVKIKNIQNQESRVSGRLKDIIMENGNIEQTVGDIVKVLSSQLERNAELGSAVNELISAVHSIREQTESEKSNGERIRESVERLDEITRAIVRSSGEQKQCNDELRENLGQLQSVSESNLEVLSDLKNLFS
jgi:methyl-accepting chemotaxis protein